VVAGLDIHMAPPQFCEERHRADAVSERRRRLQSGEAGSGEALNLRLCKGLGAGGRVDGQLDFLFMESCRTGRVPPPSLGS
jgi:hypothetical protein